MDLAERVDVFTDINSSKSSNDERNKAREDIIEALFSSDTSISLRFTKHESFGEFWSDLKNKFAEAVTSFIEDNTSHKSFKLSNLVKKGGRNFNYDFFAPNAMSGDDSGIKIEFKKGSTIFDQPEFLSLYSKNGVLIKSNFREYPSFFYDNYISDLSKLVGESAPTKETYLSGIFDTKYVGFFGSAREVYDDKRDFFLELQYKSIDHYLNDIKSIPSSIDFDQIQHRLMEQLEKFFVSWDPEKLDFSVEQFHVLDVTLDRSVSFAGGKNGLNTIVLKNASGNNVNALLRWKNYACVVGPAWQISLKTGHKGN